MKLQSLMGWVGGKRQLVPTIRKLIPSDYNTYIEPFIGAGSVFLDQQPKHAIISDTNEQLILLYQSIKDNVDELCDLLTTHYKQNSKDYFLHIRSLDRNLDTFHQLLDVEKAARLMYLVHHSYGNLYRVNLQNQMNAPFNSTKRPSVENTIANLKHVHDYMVENDVTIYCHDFEYSLELAKEGDFVYLDPPYIVDKKQSEFNGYSSNPFVNEDQVRLRDWFVKMTDKGVKVLMSNSDTERTHELYESVATVDSFSLHRNIAKGTSKNAKRKEVFIRNYEI